MLHESPTNLKVLDLAAGSGEATEVLHLWKTSRWPPPDVPSSSPPLSRPIFRPTSLLPRTLKPEPTLEITATDPFTSPAYLNRTSLPCLSLSFSDISNLLLPYLHPLTQNSSGQEVYHARDVYDIVIVSFALHLVETSSELWSLLRELSRRCKWLIVCAPHKKPDVRTLPFLPPLLLHPFSVLISSDGQIKSTWSWTRWDPNQWEPAKGRGNVGGTAGDGFEIVLDRTRLRCWRSEEHWSPV